MADSKVADQDPKGTPSGADPASQSDPLTPSEGDTKLPKGDSDSWELSVNGETVKLDEKQLIEYVSKGMDYTQKTQVLADEKKRFAPYIPFMDKMETDVSFSEKVISFVNEIESQNDNSSDDFGTDPKLLATIGVLQKQITELTQTKAFEALEGKYGKRVKVDPLEITAYMGANRITNPEVAFLMLKKDALDEAAIQEGIAIGKKGGGDASKVLVSPGKSGQKIEPKVDVKNMSAPDKKTRAVNLLRTLRGASA